MANPTGKGGFREHPELIGTGSWDKRNSFSYWMNFFKHLSVEKFRDYEKTKSEKDRTVAESLAYVRVHNARADLKEFEAVANRTEGMPKQPMELSGGLEEYRKYSDKELDAIIREKLKATAKRRKSKRGGGSEGSGSPRRK